LILIVPRLVQAPRYLAVLQVIVYFVGAAALGAMSVGHEYVDRTLNLLLSLPVRRERLLVVKLGVLTGMLTTLGVVAYAWAFPAIFRPGYQAERLALSLVPVLCGLFLAPWLTMACRSPTAGTALTVAIPVLLAMLGEWIGFSIGDRTFAMTFLWLAASAMCATGAIATSRLFMRLESIEGCFGDLPLPQLPRLRARTLPRQPQDRERESHGATAAGASLTKRHPIWRLFTKELRLQQPVLFITGLYLLGWLVVELRATDYYIDLNTALSACYAVLLAALAGSLGSAEERQLGTIEWQVLQPIAMWRQWAVKVAVVLGLPMLLGMGLPALLAHVAPASVGTRVAGQPLASNVLLLAAVSLYVSSLCGSGAWALVMSLSVTFGNVIFQNEVMGRAGPEVDAAWMFSGPARAGINLGASQVVHALDLLLIAGLIAVLARFAMANHRTADRSPRRACTQVILMVVFAAARVMILSGVAGWFGASG
jgi:hypothetical protein